MLSRALLVSGSNKRSGEGRSQATPGGNSIRRGYYKRTCPGCTDDRFGAMLVWKGIGAVEKLVKGLVFCISQSFEPKRLVPFQFLIEWASNGRKSIYNPPEYVINAKDLLELPLVCRGFSLSENIASFAGYLQFWPGA